MIWTEFYKISSEFTKILLLSETHRRPTCIIGDPLETSTCFIGDRYAPSETVMLDWRPIRDRSVPSETNIPFWRPIGERHAPLETDMPVKTHRRPTCGSFLTKEFWPPPAPPPSPLYKKMYTTFLSFSSHFKT